MLIRGKGRFCFAAVIGVMSGGLRWTLVGLRDLMMMMIGEERGCEAGAVRLERSYSKSIIPTDEGWNKATAYCLPEIFSSSLLSSPSHIPPS